MTASLKGRSILIVEDQFLAAMSLETTMRGEGASVVELAARLADAEELIDTIAFDAVFLDLRLQDVDALPLGKALIAKGVPVIVYSGHAEHRCRQALPAAIILHKPATPRQIVSAAQEAVASKAG